MNNTIHSEYYWDESIKDDHHDSTECLNRFGSNFSQLPEHLRTKPEVIIATGIRSHLHALLRHFHIEKNLQVPDAVSKKKRTNPWHDPVIVNALMMHIGKETTLKIYEGLGIPLFAETKEVEAELTRLPEPHVVQLRDWENSVYSSTTESE